MSSAVLDASALLAYIHGEPGAHVVTAQLAQGACISAVNWAEVLSKVIEEGRDLEGFLAGLREYGILDGVLEVVPLTEQDALVIAQLRPLTKAYGLSLGDRACLALGKQLGLPVFTTDRAWFALDVLNMDIQAIR